MNIDNILLDKSIENKNKNKIVKQDAWTMLSEIYTGVFQFASWFTRLLILTRVPIEVGLITRGYLSAYCINVRLKIEIQLHDFTGRKAT